jgi:PGAP1-like protein
MPRRKRDHLDDLRGASRLAIEATRGVTDLVEAMHRTIASGPVVLGRPLALPARVLTAPVYGIIRAVTRIVGTALDGALAQLQPWFGQSAPGPARDAALAALNGVLGDYLSETHNPLAVEMRLLRDGAPLEGPIRGASKVLVLVHGSCLGPHQWTRRGHNHGDSLGKELGYSVVHLQYNSGLHISVNGRAFAAVLEDLAAPAEEIVILAHSMGGLVARSACYYAEVAHHVWRSKLRALICLGSPHHGAPFERGGSWVDTLLGISSYSAPLARLGQIRSAGVTDMRFGNVLDEHWEGRGRFGAMGDLRTPLPLPEGVACYAIAATAATGPGGELPGDGPVPVASALGRHEKASLTLDFRDSWIAFGMGHLDLLDRAEVYKRITAWLGGSTSSAAGPAPTESTN